MEILATHATSFIIHNDVLDVEVLYGMLHVNVYEKTWKALYYVTYIWVTCITGDWLLIHNMLLTEIQKGQ